MKRFFRSVAAVFLALTMLISTASALTVEQAIALLEENYLRTLPPEAYEAQSLEELFLALGDPHTYYMSGEEYQAFLDHVENTVSVVGIGVSIRYTREGIEILEVLKGGSAEQAGLQAGDMILAVDGISCVPANAGHQTLIAGEEGTQVTVTVLRDGVVRHYQLTRVQVSIPNTEVEVLDGYIGYIDCSSFGLETGAFFLEGVETYHDAVGSWLVDLRGNSGGYSSVAVEALGIFAGPGFHMYLRDRAGQLYYYLHQNPAVTDHPMVVLVDGGTASAAEAFTAGVRDMGRGISVGSRTYGKGSAQIILDGDTHPEQFGEDALKVTRYRFFSAYGITNDVMGVIPTLMVSDEMAPGVAQALCIDPNAAREDQLVLSVGDDRLTVDLTGTAPEVLAALYEALPPCTYVWLHQDGVEYDVTLAEAAELYGMTCGQRWFQDVADSPYAEALNTLATYDMIHGDGDGNFYPGETLKRGEVCAMLGKALGVEGSGRQRFADVPADDEYAPYINAMADMGMVRGTGDGSFCPYETLTREEYYTILGRLARYLDVNVDFMGDGIPQEQLDGLAVRGYSDWALNGAALLTSMGNVVTGGAPEEPILREEAAAGLYGVLAYSGILP